MALDRDNILALAAREGVLDFQVLLRDRRDKGFQHYIPDLATENATGTGWTLNKGLLVVQAQHNTDELMTHLETKLAHHKWFQTRKQRDEFTSKGGMFEVPVLPVGYPSYTQLFKSLGQWGKNPAMDVVSLLTNPDGTLAVQVIVRPIDKKHAFVGGMIDKDVHTQGEAILEKCFQETLEEWYSNDLFAPGSKTLSASQKFDVDALSIAIDAVLANSEFSKLAPFKATLANIFNKPGYNFNTRIKNLETELKAQGKTQNIRPEDLEVFWVRIKCRLYQELFPQQYNGLTDFLRNNLVRMEETTNEADPRNTQVAFMTTVPHYFYIDRAELAKHQNNWMVAPKGGDDALTAKVVELDKLFEKPMFSAHARILLECVADLVEKHPELLQNREFQAQLEKIRSNIEIREAKELNLVRNDLTGLVLQTPKGGVLVGANNASIRASSSSTATVNPPAATQIPVVANTAELTQLNAASLAANSDHEEILVASSSQAAGKALETLVGQVRFARTKEILEQLGLPISSLVTLDELTGLKRVNILLDNSGSMSGDHTDGEGKRTNRWMEAKSRLKKILPLLALGGAEINIRVLNDCTALSKGNTKSFNFRKDLGANNVSSLESELGNANAFLEKLFNCTPSGGTEVKGDLSVFFSMAQSGDKQLNLFLTDGEATDDLAAKQTIMTRNAEANPLLVVACTNASAEINWIRDISLNPKSGVEMLKDCLEEEMNMRVLHGPSIPYSNSIYVLRHVALPAIDKDTAAGLQVYGCMNKVLTNDQLTEIMGYEVPGLTYQYYLSNSPLYKFQETGQVMGKSEMSQLLGTNVPEASYQYYLLTVGNMKQQQQRTAANSAAGTSSNPQTFFGRSASVSTGNSTAHSSTPSQDIWSMFK
jgi:hypothetical protein